MNIIFDAEKLNRICAANDIAYLGLFGSCAVGKQRKDSDIDLLVDFNTPKSLLEKGKVLIQLQDLFNMEVDLVSRKNIKNSLKPFINNHLVTLYGKKQPRLS